MWRVVAHKEEVVDVEVIHTDDTRRTVEVKFPKYYTVENAEASLAVLGSDYKPYRYEVVGDAINDCAKKIALKRLGR